MYIVGGSEMSNRFKDKLYAVKVGKRQGIFDSWNECKKLVVGYPNAEFKSFRHREDAEDWLYGKEFMEEQRRLAAIREKEEEERKIREARRLEESLSKFGTKLYAVKVGKETGIYRSWSACKKLVIGYPNAEFKSFRHMDDAEAWLYGESGQRVS